MELEVHLPTPHAKQKEFIDSPAKRVVVRAGRRGGKTVGVATKAVEKFLEGYRVLYAAPTSEQIGRFWTTVTRALEEPIKKKYFGKTKLSGLLNFRAPNKGSNLKVRGMQTHYVEIMEICSSWTSFSL